MPHTIIEDGDSLQIRATISDAKELGELIAKLESRRSEWKQMQVAEKVMLRGKDVLKELGDDSGTTTTVENGTITGVSIIT